MRYALPLALLAMAGWHAVADDAVHAQHSATNVPPSSRFEIIQSPILVRNTFRLDKFTGRVHEMVNMVAAEGQGALVWEEMVVHGRPAIANPTSARFQMISSGLAAKHTYLLDTATGATWQLMIASPATRSDGTPTPEHETYREWFRVEVFDLKK